MKHILNICVVLALCVSTVDAIIIRAYWIPPLLTDNGTLIDDLAGCKIYWGDSPDKMTNTKDVGIAYSSLIDLPEKSIYWRVGCYDSSGNESKSNIQFIDLTPPDPTRPGVIPKQDIYHNTVVIGGSMEVK